MRAVHKYIFGIFLLLLCVTVFYFFYSSVDNESSRAKSLVSKYIHWTDPGLCSNVGRGAGALWSFYALNKRSSHNLDKILSKDCKIISEFPDGRIVSIDKKNLLANLTGERFVHGGEQIILEEAVIEKNKDDFLVKMTIGFRLDKQVEIQESKLVIEEVQNKLLISQIKNVIRKPTSEEINIVHSLLRNGRYNPKRGLGKRSGDFSQVSFSLDGEKIVFSSLRHRSAEIYMINTNGSNLKRLTKTPYWEIRPSFTPDGQNIMFISDKDNYAGEPYLIDTDGSNYRRLIPDYLGVSDAVFSPDGKYIGFTKQVGEAREIYIMNYNNTEMAQLTESGRVNSFIVFSPDGKTIYFKQKWYDQGKTPPVCEDIFSININGTNLKQLTDNQVAKIPVAATYKHILYFLTNPYEMWLMKPNGNSNRRIVKGPIYGSSIGTKILPDYKHILFMNNRQNSSSYSIYLKELFGKGNIKQLIDDNDSCISAPDVSSDGKYVVYIGEPKGQAKRGKGNIRLLSLETGEIKTIGKNY